MIRWVGLALLCAACGNDGASATFVGAVGGDSMSPSSYISIPATVSFASGSVPVAAIVLSDAGALCNSVTANRQPSSSHTLAIFLTDVDGATSTFRVPTGTGSYPVFTVGSGSPPQHFASATFETVDGTCQDIAATTATATSGTVTLTGNAEGAYTGTYDLTFAGGDHVTGAFHTASCRGLASYLARDSHVCG